MVLAGCFLTACQIAQATVDYNARYRLEVVSSAVDAARVRIDMGGDIFREISSRSQSAQYGSGIIALKTGDKKVFDVSVVGPKDTTEDNYLLISFSGIHFFYEDSDTPYRRYVYPVGGGCSDGRSGSDCTDDARTYRRHPDGTEERLFVESPDRPFYLERDQEDPDLARIVITFVPEVGAGSAVAVD